MGCNPIAHASWAVAGWLIYGKLLVVLVAAVVGVCSSCRNCSTSVVVRVVVGVFVSVFLSVFWWNGYGWLLGLCGVVYVSWYGCSYGG